MRASIPTPRPNGAKYYVAPLHREDPKPQERRTQEGQCQIESDVPAQANTKPPLKADEPKVERVTKQERVLTLLSQPAGASIEEMMQATAWQQHSARGFLAGTVKKKLGFSLTSLKPDGGARHYRIETRRAR